MLCIMAIYRCTSDIIKYDIHKTILEYMFDACLHYLFESGRDSFQAKSINLVWV